MIDKRSPVQLGAILFSAAAILASGLYFAGRSGTDPARYGNDFNVYYFAAREILSGRDPYINSLGAWTPYLYPPVLAEMLAPFALLPLPVTAYIWFLITAGSTIAAIRLSASLASERRSAFISLLTFLILSRFALDNLYHGQVNTLVAALAVGHLYLLGKRKRGAAAWLLALAASIKLTPLLLIFYHLGRSKMRVAALCLAFFLLLVALSFAPFGEEAPAAFERFFGRTIKNEQGFDLSYSGNQSLRGALARLIGDGGEDDPVKAASLLASIALLAVAAFAATRRGDLAASSSPFFCCLVLLSPLSWKAHFIILVLPVAHLVSTALYAESKRLRAGIKATLSAVFVLFNLTSPRLIGLPRAEWADEHSLVCAGAVLLFSASAAHCLAFKQRL